MSSPARAAASRPLAEHASWPRRILALVVDWVASTLVVIAVLGLRRYTEESGSTWVLLVYAVEASLFTALAGGSFGQLLTGIRVLTTEGRPLNLLQALARTLLICVVIPPLIFQSGTGRGLHDLWTGSGAYRRG